MLVKYTAQLKGPIEYSKNLHFHRQNEYAKSLGMTDRKRETSNEL